MDALAEIVKVSSAHGVPVGMHIVQPNREELKSKILEGYQFLAYSMDSVILRVFGQCGDQEY